MTESEIYNGVEFGVKERFVPALPSLVLGSLLFDFQTTGAEARPVKVFGYYGDDKDPGTSGQITIRQEGGILTKERTSYLQNRSDLVHITYSGAGQDERQHLSKLVLVLYLQSAEYQSLQTSAELVGWNLHIQWNGRRILLCSDSRRILQQLHYLEQEVAQRRIRMGWFWNSYTQATIKESLLVSYFLTTGSGTFSILGGAAESTVEPSAARAILTDITGVAETRYFQVFQDFVPSGTFTLSGELTHPEIDLHTTVHWIWNYNNLWICRRGGSCQRDWCWYCNLSLVDLLSESQRRSGRNSPLRYKKGASALNQVYGYYGDDRDPGTSGITTISGVGITKPIQVFGYYGDDKDPGTSGGFTFSNTPLVHPFVDYTPSIGIGVAVLYQTSGTALESFTFANYETQGRFKGLAGSKESLARATYVGIGQINTFGAGQTEYAVIEEGRTYVVII